MHIYVIELVNFFQVVAEQVKSEARKYTVKPPRDLRSKFIIKMEARRKKEEEEEEAKRAAEEEERIAVSCCW